MTRDKLSLSKKVSLLFLITSFFTYNITFAQCTNLDPTGSTSQTFCVSANSTVNYLVASGGTIAWFDALTGGNQYTGTAPLFNGTTYYADDIDGGGCSPNRLAVTVTLYGDVPSDVDVFVGKCAITNPTIADLSATGSNIEWYAASTGDTLLPLSEPLINGTVYWVQQTENGCISARFPTAVTVIDPPPPAVAVTQSFCTPPSPTVADLIATGSGITWYDTETSIAPVDPATLLIDGEDYWASQQDAVFPCESKNRAQTTIVLDQLPEAGTNGSYVVCEIDVIITDLFTLLGGTPDTTGTWSGPSTLTGGHLGTFDPTTNTPGVYTYAVNSPQGVCPVAETTVTVTITLVPPPTISEVNQVFCEIDDATIADLVATGTSLLWYDTETSTTPLNLSDALVNGEDYWASDTDTSSGCESTTRIVVNISIIMPPPPTTSNASQTFCEMDGATVANLDTTGTSILWYDTNTSTTPLNSTDLLIDGEDYWASDTDATSGCESASRLVINVSIVMPPPPTTSNITQAFCEIDGATIADISVSGTGIIWYDSDTSTTPLNDTDLLVDGEDYWATQTDGPSGCESVARLVVTVSIIIPPPPTTSNTTQAFCEIDGAIIGDLTISGTGIIWYDTETSTTALNPSDLLVDGEDYWASATDTSSGCESVSRIVITVSIIMPPPPTVTETNQAFCEIDGATVGDLSAGGTSILWYDTDTSTTPLNSGDALIGGEDYWASNTDTTTGCESSTRLVVNVFIIMPPPPSTSNATQTFCEIDGATVADLSATGNSILWYDTDSSTTPLNLTDLLVDGEDYWASDTNATSGCESSVRLMVTVSLTIPPPPTTTEINQSFCEIDSATIADLSASGMGIIWYDTNTSTTPLNATDLLVDSEDYWATQTDVPSGCESAGRLVINVTIIMPPPPTTTITDQSFCLNDFLPGVPTIANLSVSGTSISWYDAETSTTPLNSADILIDGEDYWASDTDTSSGCESATRIVINVRVVDLPEPTTTNATQEFCLATTPTVGDLQANESNIYWYDTNMSTTPLNSGDVLVDGEDYWATQFDSAIGCESMSRLMVTVSIINVTPPTISIVSQNFCTSDNSTIADISVTGSVIVWYESETATTPLSNTDLLVDGEDYWAAESDVTTGCESSVRVVVTITLINPGTPTISSSGNEFCKINNPTIADLNANVTTSNGGTISWYNAYPNGNLLNLTDSLSEGGAYFAVENDVSGCSSVNALEVTVTLEACDAYDIEIYDGFSPTGDGTNDTFVIKNLRDLYPDFRVEFFNRWGSKIYTSAASKPDWNGRLNGNGELVPAGVYYVIVYFNKDGRKPIQERLYISR